MPTSYQQFKNDFLADTGLDIKANIHAYIQYVQARLLEQMIEQQKTLSTQLTQILNRFPSV